MIEYIIQNRQFTGDPAVKNKKAKKGEVPKLTKYENMKLVKATLLKYKLFKFRSKLSFMAFKKCQTVPELILRQIKASFDYFVQIGHIKNPTTPINE